MEKTISNIKDLAKVVFHNSDYSDFMSYISVKDYNSARLFLDGCHTHDPIIHDRLEDILIDLIMKREDEEGGRNEQAIGDS